MNRKPRIVIHNEETRAPASKLKSVAPEAEVVECNSYDALPSVLKEFRPDIVYTVRFAGAQGYPRDALFSDHGPAWIANGGSGVDHFGIWDPKRTQVTNAAGAAAHMMAEFVIGGFLHFTLDIPGLQSDKANKVWRARTIRALRGQTLLILGLGRTGQAIAEHAKAFGMTVIGTRARPQPMACVDQVCASNDLHALLPRADFIAVSTPLTDQTRGLLGAPEFAAMKPGIILADVSRGGVIRQTDLMAAMASGQVAAAILDVFETEPLDANNPIWDLEPAIISPHASAIFEGIEDASFDIFLANLERWMSGEQMTHLVDPDRGY